MMLILAWCSTPDIIAGPSAHGVKTSPGLQPLREKNSYMRTAAAGARSALARALRVPAVGQ